MFKKIILLCMVLILFSACSFFTSEEPIIEYEEGVKTSEHAKNVEIISHASKDSSVERTSKIGQLRCDLTTNELSFLITNLETKTWSIDRIGTSDTPELTNINIIFNGRVMNAKFVQPHPTTKEDMFGPQKEFSKNCQDTKILRPQTSTRCTTKPVYFEEENVLRVEGEGRADQITFRCEG